MAPSNWMRSRLGISPVELIQARDSTKNHKPSLTPLPPWSGTPCVQTSWSERNRGVGRVCTVWSAKTRRFPSSRRGLGLAPPIGCKLSTNRKRKPKWRRCVAASIAVGPSAILTGSRTRPSDWGWSGRFGPVEGRRNNRRLATVTGGSLLFFLLYSPDLVAVSFSWRKTKERGENSRIAPCWKASRDRSPVGSVAEDQLHVEHVVHQHRPAGELILVGDTEDQVLVELIVDADGVGEVVQAHDLAGPEIQPAAAFDADARYIPAALVVVEPVGLVERDELAEPAVDVGSDH